MATTATTTAPSQTNGATHPYTCNTCQVAFRGSELQRGHMQSDWHRYNLKRRVASLPPLTSEIFAEKVLANQASAAATAARAQFEKICSACSRTYFSENAYNNHLQSQKHKLKLIELSKGPDLETEDGTESMTSSAFSLGESVATTTKASDAGSEVSHIANGLERADLNDSETPIPRALAPGSTPSASTPHSESTTFPSEPTLQCLFCNLSSESTTQNITHMSRQHGLFVPEQTYLIDLPGLLSYLQERVHILHECLYCSQTKYTSSGVQTHMRDKGHCMIAFESEEEMIEVGQFYDFTSTYSDDEDEEEADVDGEKAHAAKPRGKLGGHRAAQYETEDGEVDGDDEDWEEEEGSDDDEQDGEESEADASGTRDSDKPFRPSRQRTYATDAGLHLPSGRLAGHRSLARFYRQNLHSYPTPAERVDQQQLLLEEGVVEPGAAPYNPRTTRALHSNTDGQQVMLRGRTGREVVSRAGGGLGMMGATTEQKKEAARLEFKERRKAERAENRYRAGNERAANNQKHFRDPLLQ